MKLEEVKGQKILLSALNWGMGHVSRCIGLIRRLQEQENELFIACDPDQQVIFESYFPDLTFIAHAAYPFDFSGNGNFGADLFANRKKLLPRFAKEQKEVKEYIEKYVIDLVISDHRYGFFSKDTPSVFVTHQLNLPLKWFQFPAQWLHKRLMQNFTQIWCMDDKNNSLAGKLSASIPHFPIEYIGWFSRFEPKTETEEIDILFVVSGPEPYAEQFFREITAYSEKTQGKLHCIAPRLYETENVPENLEITIASDWQSQEILFHQSKKIVSRAGYSTLMDLKILNKKAFLVPTPGQAEQGYLSQLHAGGEDWEFGFLRHKTSGHKT